MTLSKVWGSIESAGSTFRFGLIAFLSIFIMNLFVYGDTLGHPFMMEDQSLFVAWAKPFNVNSFLSCFNPFAKELIYYRPLTSFVFLLLNHLSNGDPFYCRFFILLIYSIFISLFYELTSSVFKSRMTGFLSAVLLSVHPFQGFYVNYINASSVLIWGLMMTASLAAHQFYILTGKERWLYSSGALGVAALASHEMAGLLPVFIFCLNGLAHVSVRKSLQRAGIFALLVAGWHLPRILFFPRNQDILGMVKTGIAWMGLDVSNVTPSLMVLAGWYVKQFFLPTEVLFMKTIWPVTQSLIFLNGLIGCLFLYYMWVLFRLRHSNLVWLFVWFFVALSSLGGAFLIAPAQGLTIEPHWFLVGSFAVYWMVSLLLIKIYREINKVLACGLIIFVLIFLMGWTKNYNYLWRSQESYCLYWLEKEPNESFPSFWLGADYLRKGRYKEADYYLQKSLSGWYIDWETFIDLGSSAIRQKRWDDGVLWSKKAIALNPSAVEAYNNLGVISFENGDAVKAKEYFSQALLLNPKYYKARENLEVVKRKFHSQK